MEADKYFGFYMSINPCSTYVFISLDSIRQDIIRNT